VTHDRPILETMHLDDLYRLLHYVSTHEAEQDDLLSHAERQRDEFMKRHYEARAEQCRCFLSELRWYISKAEESEA